MSTFILELAGLSAVMAVIILVLMMLKKPLGRLSAWSRYVIWAVVILRLCVPVTLGGTPSIFTFELPDTVFTQKETAQTEAVTSVIAESYVPVLPSVTESVQQSKPIVDTAVPENTVSPVTSDEPTVILPAATEKSPQTQSVIPEKLPTAENKTEEPVSKGIDTEELLSALFAVWAMGAAVFFAYRMTGYSAFVLSVKKSGRVKKAEGRVARIYASVGEALGIKRLPALYVAYYPISPMLCGYLKPKMIIPDLEFWGEDRIRAVLAHELIHYRRGDLYAKLLCTVAEALHWFNPAVHKAASRFNSAMELACDEIVIRKLGTAERAVYGDALLNIVRRCEGVKESPMTTALSGNAGAVKERIMNILDTGKKRRGISIIAVTLVICMIAGAVVGCAVKDSGNATETPVTENENGNGNENAEAVYYVPEYMRIVKENDTYEATLTFEGDKIIAERTKNGEEDVTYTAVFDGDRLTAVEVRDAAGELLRTKELSYDEVGNVTLIAYTSADNTREYSRTEYAYEGELLKSITYTEDDEPGRYKISYTHLEDGRVLIENRNRTMYYLHHEKIKYHYNNEKHISMTELYTSYDGTKPTLKETFEVKEWDTDKILSSVNNYDVPDYYTYNLDGERISTYTYDSFGNVLTHRIDSKLERYDTDNIPNWAVLTNTYTEDGRHLTAQTVEGNYFNLENSLLEYRGKFDAEKLESSGFIYQGTQIKWHECDKNEYLRYRAVYETVDTLSEEAERGYLLDIDNHMWCFDDVVTDIAYDAEPYAIFEGKNIELEAEARKEWYNANGFTFDSYEGGKTNALEAFLTGDIDRLGEYVFATEGAYESYLGMKIGNYKLESMSGRFNDQVIALTVEILESNHELLTPGTHTLIAERTLNTELMTEDVYFDTDYSVYEEPFNKRAGCLLRYGIADVDEFRSGINGEYNEFATWLCIYGMMDNYEEYMKIIEKNGGNGLIAENLKAYAEKYLGVPDFEPHTGDRHKRYAYTYNGQYYNSVGRGDNTPAISYGEQVTDGNKVTVTIHGWADQSRTVKSKTVEYVFEKLDGGIKIVSSRILEDTGFDLSLGNGT